MQDVVAFAQRAPFTIDAATSKYSGFTIIVSQDALADYNTIFRYFEPGDSTKARVYRDAQADLFWWLPITNLESTQFRADGDTLLATVVFQRPERTAFETRIGAVLSTDTTVPPSIEQRSAFADAVSRLRAELQETDTAYLTLVKGPKIIGLRTARSIREAAIADSLAEVARSHLGGLVDAATITVVAFNDYADLTLLGEPMGASIEGMVDPGSIGWYRDTRVYSGVAVQCEGQRDTSITRVEGYVGTDRGSPDAPDDFVCLWIGEDAWDWTRIKPAKVRVRLIAHVSPDSMFGQWIDVR